jgi:lipoprotein signal peptidase
MDHTQIQWRGNSTRDPADILHPDFDTCTTPLVFWPWWAFNMADWFIGSVSSVLMNVERQSPNCNFDVLMTVAA